MTGSAVPAEWPTYSPTAVERAAELVRSGAVFDYSGGGPVLELEQEFAKRHEGRLALSFNSGTSALFAAYSALGLAPGDEVLVPNLTFLATASPLLWLGATPVLADCGADDPCLTVAALERALTARTRAVAVTHVFGFPAGMSGIMRFARQHNLAVVADCSHAHGSTIDGRPVGVFGDVAVYSVGARKMVSGGHGGVILTDDPGTRDSALLIGHFKPRSRAEISSSELRSQAEFGLGGNLRMSPLAAVLALDHLAALEDVVAAKLANVAVLDRALADRLVPLATSPDRVNGTFFDLVYELPPDAPTAARDRVLRELDAVGVAARAPATRPLNRVLRAIAANPADRRGVFWHRLADVAARAPRDDALPHSTGRHDRMVSFPATHLHDPDVQYARVLAEAVNRVDWPAALAPS
jgi:dTDP-4-amino-4,6-dideoxygalactose transaminase